MRALAALAIFAGLALPGRAAAEACSCEDPEAGFYGMGLDVAPVDGALETPDPHASEPSRPTDTPLAAQQRGPVRVLWCTASDPSRCHREKGDGPTSSLRAPLSTFVCVLPSSPELPGRVVRSTGRTACDGLGSGSDLHARLDRPPRFAR